MKTYDWKLLFLLFKRIFSHKWHDSAETNFSLDHIRTKCPNILVKKTSTGPTGPVNIWKHSC